MNVEQPSSALAFPERRRRGVRRFLRIVQYLLDLGMLAVSFRLAYLLRYDFQIPAARSADFARQLPWAVLIQFGALIAVGAYRFIWRYVGLPELKAFVGAAFLSAAPLLGLRIFLSETHQSWRIPISIIVMSTILGFGSLFGMRVLRRAFYERGERLHRAAEKVRMARKLSLLVG